MKKTIREWLSEELSTKHYELLLKYNPLNDWDINMASSLSDALYGSTGWRYTEEGYGFWESIYYDIYYNRYNKYSNNIFLKL